MDLRISLGGVLSGIAVFLGVLLNGDDGQVALDLDVGVFTGHTVHGVIEFFIFFFFHG